VTHADVRATTVVASRFCAGCVPVPGTGTRDAQHREPTNAPGGAGWIGTGWIGTVSQPGVEAGGLLGRHGTHLVEIDPRRATVVEEHLTVGRLDPECAHAGRERHVPGRVAWS
jgi:hypothetical protein